ncbi:hypothetical protein [Flavobacterium sp. 5]|uniref:hypothetical protein n=1 Tax=Flavobacterium sp. 5 TaxID=2035199 RepID=UPI000C2CBBE6|nr:hypothetical protein [Flavobacterium sp. 5]PKB17703.1 hypothetical protein CLU82_2929 [Flavobacterium sp. 5]
MNLKLKFFFGVVIMTSILLGLGIKSCSKKQNIPTSTSNNYDLILTERENASAEKETNYLGQLINTISFNVKTDNTEFENGIQSWASIEKPQNDLKNLIDRNQIVINEDKITVIIDYPLKNEYRFDLKSANGFDREKLLLEISKHYYELYEEEEKTATVKTLPMEKRTMYNRNETNGKYGVWGHDIADLVLTDIFVYKNKSGKIILALNVDS